VGESPARGSRKNCAKSRRRVNRCPAAPRSSPAPSPLLGTAQTTIALCPFGPGRRKVGETAATGSPDRTGGQGEWGAAHHSQAGEPRGCQIPEDPGDPGGTSPRRMGIRTSARVATNEYMESWEETGDVTTMPSRGSPATEQAEHKGLPLEQV
jgi:hypothetical protein